MFFIFLLIVLGWIIENYLLVGIGLLAGTIGALLFKQMVDEREKTIREQATKLTYSIFTPTIALGSLFLLIFTSGRLPTVKEEFYYLQSLGVIFAYLTLFLMTLYAIFYFYLSKKYGGGDEE